MVLKRIDIRPDPSTGLATGVIFGHDEIACGGSFSSLWHVTAYSDAVSKIAGDQDYLICSGAVNGCTQSSGTWDLASAQPFTGNLPPPGFQAIFANPISDQTILQPTGTSLKIIGTLDLSQAVVIGFAGGSGGSGSTIKIDGVATTQTVNFSSTTPAALANATNITFQADGLSPTNVSASIRWATSAAPGLMSLASDIAGGTASAPQVVSTHLLAALPVIQGGTGQTSINAAFNALAPAAAAANALMISTGPGTWGTLPLGTGCLQGNATSLQFLPCTTGTITGAGVIGRIAVFSTSSNIASSDISQITGTSLQMFDDVLLQDTSSATSSQNTPSRGLDFNAHYWTGASSALDTFEFRNILGTGANPTATLTLTHTGSSGFSGMSTGALGLGVGLNTVPGNCSAASQAVVNASGCTIDAITNLDIEQTNVTNPLARSFNVFNFMSLNLSGSSILNYFNQKVLMYNSPSNVHTANGTSAAVNLNAVNAGGVGGSVFRWEGAEIGASQVSQSATVGELNGARIFATNSCATANCAAVTLEQGLVLQTGGGVLSGPIANDYTLHILSPGFNATMGTMSNHAGIYIEDQTVGANPNPFGIFEVNPAEKNTLGSVTIQGTLLATNAIVDFSGASHTLSAKAGLIANIPPTCTFVAGSAMEVYLATDQAPGQNWYFCTAANAWTNQLNSGSGSMATNASNASAVAVPNGVDWKPASAGGAGLGTVALPWSSVFIGSAATNNVQLVTSGSPTGSRQAQFPDNTGVVAELNLAQTYTATETFGVTLASSITSRTGNAALTGFLALANSDKITFRNGTNAADITALSVDSSNNVYLGQAGAASVRFPNVIGSLTAGASLTIQPTASTGIAPGATLSLFGGNCASTGLCGDVILGGGIGGTGGTSIVQVLSPLTFPLTNAGSGGTALNKLVSYNASGQGLITSAGAINGLAGVCAEGCGTAGIAQIAKLGTIALNLDNTGLPGDYVGISSITGGFGHDCGATPCSTQLVGVVRGSVSGTLYSVDLLLGSVNGGSGSSANAIVNNPAVTQTIQATSSTAISLAVECPTGAASNLACFRVLDNTGATIFEIHQDASQQSGTGTAGTLTAAHFQGNTAPHAATGVLECADTDTCMAFRNHANNADDTISKDINDALTFASFSIVNFNPGRLGLTETTAPAGAVGVDELYANSTFHSLLAVNNNGTERRVGYTMIVRPIAGTTDTVGIGQKDTWTTYSSGSAIAVTLAQSTGEIGQHFCFRGQATAAGAVTYTPTTSTINGGATFVVGAGKVGDICADGLGNYVAALLPSAAGSGDMLLGSPNVMTGSGTLNGTSMSTTAGLIFPTGAGAVPVSGGVNSYDSTLKRDVFGDGTITIGLGKISANSQSGTTYIYASADCSRNTFFSNAGAVAVTLPQAGTSFPNGCQLPSKNDGAGSVTVTPTTSTIDGAASITLTTGQSVVIVSDGTNYKTEGRGTASGLNDPGSNGVLVRTALNTTIARTLTSTLNGIIITFGGGTSGNPTFALDTTQVALLANAITLQNKTLDNTNAITVLDTLLTIQDNVDSTKQLAFQLSTITTATTRTLTVPDRNIILAGVTGALTSGNLSSFDASGNLIDSAIAVANVVTQASNASANQVCTYTGANKICVPGLVTSAMMAPVNARRTCDIVIGDSSGSVLINGQLGPQKRMCFIPAAATIVEVDVSADGGTPSIILARNRAGSVVNLVSSALATGSSGAIACSNTGGTTGIDGATTCSATLQNTSFNAGDYIEAVSGTAGGTAKLFTAHVTWTVN